MECIDTAVERAAVMIEGTEYPVAEKTVAVVEKLLAAQHDCAGKPEYRLWLAELEVLLGKPAVKALFRDGKRENIDRMQAIHAGVCAAFERNSDRIDRETATRRSEAFAQLAEAVEPINALLRQLEQAQAQVIRRGE